jgi:hypothetical protein
LSGNGRSTVGADELAILESEFSSSAAGTVGAISSIGQGPNTNTGLTLSLGNGLFSTGISGL